MRCSRAAARWWWRLRWSNGGGGSLSRNGLRSAGGLAAPLPPPPAQPAARGSGPELATGPDLRHFIRRATEEVVEEGRERASDPEDPPPYLSRLEPALGCSRKVYFETYGCQMNVSDTEIAWSILRDNGYIRTNNSTEADVVLLVTCSIREKAEQTIWNRLKHFVTLKDKRTKSQVPLKIGILGCMAERLKEEILEREKLVDVLAGPDSYRDLPRLLTVAEAGQKAVNVLLSLDETYADVMPVQVNSKNKSAFISIMRGCNNMCSYCIVPFTRGRERSRPVSSILEEVRVLSDQGVKEVTLLGQNVNSYCDTSEVQFHTKEPTHLSRGFHTVYKSKHGGLRFADLLEQVSTIDPEMRIRFTSPHPKDFPDEVLHIIQARDNICKLLHLPIQSGSSQVLRTMRRGNSWEHSIYGERKSESTFQVHDPLSEPKYTRESYLELVERVRRIIPGVCLSSDFIAGFCGETEDDHLQTISVLRLVRYNIGFLFAYSMRKHIIQGLSYCGRPEVTPCDRTKLPILSFKLIITPVHMKLLNPLTSVHRKNVPILNDMYSIWSKNIPNENVFLRKKTHAHHRLQDDVPATVKQRRLQELISVFREEAAKLNSELIGSEQLVLVEGFSKKSEQELCGRNDGNTKVIFPNVEIACNQSPGQLAPVKPGDYVLVQITAANSQSLKGIPVCHTTLKNSARLISKQHLQ